MAGRAARRPPTWMEATLDAVGQGTQLSDRYRLDERTAVSGDGETWRATDLRLEREVVVRLLPAGHPQAADLADAARRALMVQDPRLHRVLDVGQAPVPFLVTETVPGRELGQLVSAGPLPAEVVRTLVGEAAQALDHAARRGLRHLRLRPSSLLVRSDGTVCLRGVAVDAAAQGIELPDSDTAAREDAVGLVRLLYAGLTGRWPGSGAGELPAAPRVAGRAVPPADLVAGIPNDLDTLCAVTLGPHRDGPRTPAELATELAPWARPRPVELAGALNAAGPSRPPTPVSGLPLAPADAPEPARQHERPDPDTDELGATQDLTDRREEDPASAGQGAAATLAVLAGSAAERAVALRVAATGRLRRAGLLPAAGRRAAAGRSSDAAPEADRPPFGGLFGRPDQPADGPRAEPGRGRRRPAAAATMTAEHEHHRVAEMMAGAGLTRDEPDAASWEEATLTGLLPGESETRRDRSWILIVLLILALAAGLVFAVNSLRSFGTAGNVLAPSGTIPAGPATSGSSPGASSSAAQPPVISKVTVLDPQGDGKENDALLPNLTDGKPRTNWHSSTYTSQAFGNLKDGLGLQLQTTGATPTTLVLAVAGSGGQIEVRAATRPDRPGTRVIAAGKPAASPLTFDLSGLDGAPYITLWCTKLPQVGGQDRLQISEMSLR